MGRKTKKKKESDKYVQTCTKGCEITATFRTKTAATADNKTENECGKVFQHDARNDIDMMETHDNHTDLKKNIIIFQGYTKQLHLKKHHVIKT